MQEVLVKSNLVQIATIILVGINLLPLVANIPVFVQLLLSSCCCVYIGCSFASRVAQHPEGDVIKAKKTSDEETVTTQDAMRFPITASIVLFSLYVLYKYVSPDLVNFLLKLQFCLLTVVSMTNLLMPYLPFPELWKIPMFRYKMPKLLKESLDLPDL